MIPIRSLTAAVVERFSLMTLGEPISLTLGADEAWSPRIQGTMTVSTNVVQAMNAPGGSVALGKEQRDIVSVLLTTDYGPRFTVADFTAEHGGSIAAVTAAHGGRVASVTAAHVYPWNSGEAIEPISSMTAMFGGAIMPVSLAHGGNVAAITAALRVPGGSYDPPPSEQLLARLIRRSITPDSESNIVTYELSGDEIRLHDYRRFATTTWVSPHSSLRALVTEFLMMLAGLPGTPELAPGADAAITPGTEWKPGQSMWDFLHPIMEAVGFSLWADFDGRYYLDGGSVTTAPVALNRDDNLISYAPSADFTRSFADGAVVEYTGAVDDSTRYDVYVTPGAARILHESRPGSRPGGGAAEQIVRRSATRAYTANATTLAELRLRPLHRVPILTGLYPEYGTIQSLKWDYESAETTLELRDISS